MPTETTIYLSSDFRVLEKTSKKGNKYKCLEVFFDEKWHFVAFLK